MARGAKTRSQLLRRRYDEVVALHRRARGDDPVVIVVVESAQQDELPVAVAPGTDDGETVLASMGVADARAWLGGAARAGKTVGDAVDTGAAKGMAQGMAQGMAKWDERAPDAMDVAVIAGGGISVMRLTAR